MVKKPNKKITYSQKDRRTLSEIRKLTSTGTNRPIVHEINRMLNKKTEFVRTELADMYEKTEKGINDIKTGIYSLEKQQKEADQKLNITHQKLEKIEKETDSSGKVQGIFDFTFAIITITIAILLLPSSTFWIKIAGFLLIGVGLIIFIRLAFGLLETEKKMNIRNYTYTQIILSIIAIILYMVDCFE